MPTRREFLVFGATVTASLATGGCLAKGYTESPQTSQTESPKLPLGKSYLTEEEIAGVVSAVKIGAETLDPLTGRSSVVLEDYSVGIRSTTEFSGITKEPFLFLKRADNIFSSEGLPSRPNKLFLTSEGDLIPVLYVESFWPGIAAPLNYIERNTISEESVAFGFSKELLALGMIDGFSEWLQVTNAKDYEVVTIKGEPIASTRDLNDLQKKQFGLSLFFSNTISPNKNNDIWWAYDTLPLFVAASGLEGYKNSDAFSDFPRLKSALNYLTSVSYNGKLLINTIASRLYNPLMASKTMQTDNETLQNLLTHEEFRQIVNNFRNF